MSNHVFEGKRYMSVKEDKLQEALAEAARTQSGVYGGGSATAYYLGEILAALRIFFDITVSDDDSTS